MSTPCIIERTFTGSAEKNYYLIKYIQTQLESKGLNPQIDLVISDEDRMKLFQFPSFKFNTMRESNDAKSTTTTGTSFFSLTDFFKINPTMNKVEESKKETPKSFFDYILGSKDSENKSTTVTVNPNDLTEPYRKFDETMKMYLGGGGGIGEKQHYGIESVKIMIRIG